MQRCFKKYKKSNSDNHWVDYKNARNEYQKHLSEAEANYKKKLSETLATNKNKKVWWSTVKNLLGKGQDISYPHLNVNNKMVRKCTKGSRIQQGLFISFKYRFNPC